MRLIACLLLITCPSILLAASHPEVTVIPLGAAQVPKGVSQPKYILPSGVGGPLAQAVVIAGNRPRKMVPGAAVVAPGQPSEKEAQVPATIKFTIAGKELPTWELKDFTTAYVINLAALKTNPGFGQSQLELKIELITAVEGMALPMFGMPDPLLLNDTLSGPLTDFMAQASDPDVKAYFEALVADFGSRKQQPADWQAAREIYQKLTSSKNEQVARLARRGLRKTAYDLRPHNPSGNLNERYRWGLYLQQCGLLAPAFTEFDQCRIIDPRHVDSCFRAGELIERLNGGIIKTMDYLERAGEAAAFRNPATWYSLVIIERKRGERVLTADELKSIKINWLLVQADVWGATEGRLKIVNSFYEITENEPRKYVQYAPGVEAPASDIVETRGWFDSVISVRPRLPEDAGKTTVSVGGDRGPNGAALSALYHDAPWPDYYKAWFEHFAWAAKVGEQFEGIPDGAGIRLCGLQPLHSDAAGCRSLLRYYLSNTEYPRPRICDEARPGECIRLWKLEGTFPIVADKSAEHSANHLNRPLTPSGDVHTISYDSPKDFINLKRVFGAGPALARATSWVFSPDDQTVRMWIGQNDGAAVTLNNRRIHEGKYFSYGNYEDRNMVDMIAAWAPLKRGWNELVVVVEGMPAPRDKDWGFSIRLCTAGNQPINGVAYLNKLPSQDLAPAWRAPSAGPYYEWQDVKEDFRERLPRLADADLHKITGLPGLAFSHQLTKQGGYCALTSAGTSHATPYRAPPASWQAEKDRDVVLNNLMDWMREASAAIRFEKDGNKHDLLLLKPEAMEAYLVLLKEPAAAEKLFRKLPVRNRVLGYVVIKENGLEFPVFVLDTLLSESDKWPADEEDLLEPISPVFIPNKPKTKAPVGPPVPAR